MGKAIYIFSNGQLSRKDNTISLETFEGKKYIPVERISEIYIFGEVDITKKFLELATQNQIIVHFYNYHEYYVGSYYPREHLNSGYMILMQTKHYLDENERLILARKFIDGSRKNIRKVLNYYCNRKSSSYLEETLHKIEELGEKIKNIDDINTLMSIEGNIRKCYYQSFDEIIDNDDFIFENRSKRPPKNQLNAMISFGNSVIYTVILSEIYKTHLDPRIGYLHTTNYRRFSLNLDLAEIFKPIIVDRTIFSLIAKKEITTSDFEKDSNGILMKDSGRKKFVQELDSKLNTTITTKSIGKPTSYRGIIRKELYKLEKHLIGEKEYKSFVAEW